MGGSGDEGAEFWSWESSHATDVVRMAVGEEDRVRFQTYLIDFLRARSLVVATIK